MKISATVYNEIKKEVDAKLSIVSRIQCQDYYIQTCIPGAKSDPVAFFTGNFISCYFAALKTLDIDYGRSGYNDDHIFTALRKALKSNNKTAFIFKSPQDNKE
jgi:hypothetical protein